MEVPYSILKKVIYDPLHFFVSAWKQRKTNILINDAEARKVTGWIAKSNEEAQKSQTEELIVADKLRTSTASVLAVTSNQSSPAEAKRDLAAIQLDLRSGRVIPTKNNGDQISLFQSTPQEVRLAKERW